MREVCVRENDLKTKLQTEIKGKCPSVKNRTSNTAYKPTATV